MLKFIKNCIKAVIPEPAVTFVIQKVLVPVKLRFNLPLRMPRRKITFEVHLAEHCNLNCCGCDHFSPLAEPEFVDIEEFKRDMKRMGDIFSHECEIISLLGGEPLLNPQIIELMKITRDNFPKGIIQIITNGILLAQQSKDFWAACRDNDITIFISRYPIQIDFKCIKSIADEFGVSCKYYGVVSKQSFSKRPLDLSGSGDIRRNFASCRRSACTTLKHGKLYICSFIPHVDIFNKAFNQNITITEEDYIDIYQDVKADEILAKLAQPVPACRYCDVEGTNADIEWHVSKREMSEWV